MTTWQPNATFGGVIDVSHWNGIINWPIVPASITMVMIKATQGASGVDPMFAANREGALDTGRMVVPYHFLTAEDVGKQAANFLRTTEFGDGKPVMIDWEPVPPSMVRAPIPIMEAFCQTVEKLIRRSPLTYHGMFDLSSPIINAFPWMIPKYGPQPQGPKWLFWQDRPNLHVPGIPNLTDHSVFAGTANELVAWYNTGAMPKGF